MPSATDPTRMRWPVPRLPSPAASRARHMAPSTTTMPPGLSTLRTTPREPTRASVPIGAWRWERRMTVRMTTNQASDHSTPRTARRPSTRSSGDGLANSHQDPAAVSPAAPAVARPRPPMAASTVNRAWPASRSARASQLVGRTSSANDGQQETGQPGPPGDPEPGLEPLERQAGGRGQQQQVGQGRVGQAVADAVEQGAGQEPDLEAGHLERPAVDRLPVEPPDRVGQGLGLVVGQPGRLGGRPRDPGPPDRRRQAGGGEQRRLGGRVAAPAQLGREGRPDPRT